jgi:hypothetical protein
VSRELCSGEVAPQVVVEPGALPEASDEALGGGVGEVADDLPLIEEGLGVEVRRGVVAEVEALEPGEVGRGGEHLEALEPDGVVGEAEPGEVGEGRSLGEGGGVVVVEPGGGQLQAAEALEPGRVEELAEDGARLGQDEVSEGEDAES